MVGALGEKARRFVCLGGRVRCVVNGTKGGGRRKAGVVSAKYLARRRAGIPPFSLLLRTVGATESFCACRTRVRVWCACVRACVFSSALWFCLSVDGLRRFSSLRLFVHLFFFWTKQNN